MGYPKKHRGRRKQGSKEEPKEKIKKNNFSIDGFKEKINFIRKISLSLFIFSLLSLIGSLWLQNTLAAFKFNKNIYDEKTNISGIF